MQGYNAQAITNEHQIVLAAEITVEPGDFGHLEPMVTAAERELAAAGVTQPQGWRSPTPATGHQVQMQNIINRGTQVLVPPDSIKRKSPSAGMRRRRIRPHAPRACDR
jgi:hypothetical protein